MRYNGAMIIGQPWLPNRFSMGRPLVLSGALLAAACGSVQTSGSALPPCSEAWQTYVEARFPTGDSEGHGPDVGSLEWRSVVEFKLGIRGDPAVPARESADWCEYIDDEIRRSGR